MVYSCGSLTAQNNSADHEVNVEIPEVALLGLVSGNTTSTDFTASSPVEAGNSIDFSHENQNSDIWINYSSIIQNAMHRRKIVAFVQGKIPEGIRLKVRASEAKGSGKGKLGRSNGEIMLSEQPSEIISDIGSCYTGKGPNNGHFLTYELEYHHNSDVYANLSANQTTLNVIYTLTDYN